MTDKISLDQTVITDQEAQFSGDVETPFLELVHQAAAPASTTDKDSSLIYAIAADDSVRIRSQAGGELNISKRLIGAGRSQMDSRQIAASTETLRLFRALAAGKIVSVAAETGVVAAAAESMTFDVEIGGVTCLTGVITIDDTVVIDTPEAGVVNTAANTFAAGDLIRVVRTYVAGGAPTPMSSTVVDVQLQFT